MLWIIKCKTFCLAGIAPGSPHLTVQAEETAEEPDSVDHQQTQRGHSPSVEDR